MSRGEGSRVVMWLVVSNQSYHFSRNHMSRDDSWYILFGRGKRYKECSIYVAVTMSRDHEMWYSRMTDPDQLWYEVQKLIRCFNYHERIPRVMSKFSFPHITPYNQESLALKALKEVRVLHLQPWMSQALVKNSSFQ
ncbi:hypothetical protein HAX54_001081, partial [Datura stramonium]|nr:hypothetical protein [Datura stramonium]